jgi:DNA-binding winged helix-turn-helix (wHTH) protein
MPVNRELYSPTPASCGGQPPCASFVAVHKSVRQLLVHAGASVRIGSRALAILTVLVEGAGDLVTKEKLIAAAWPNTFVDDSNLKVNIANLRRALPAIEPGQDYIATVPGRGYRFVAPVYRIGMRARGLPSKILLIGRADDLATVQGWRRQGPVVTVVGTGEIGKTAFETAHVVAAEYPDGISFVDLAKISAAEFISVALLFSLGLRTGGEDPLTEIIHALEGQHSSCGSHHQQKTVEQAPLRSSTRKPSFA